MSIDNDPRPGKPRTSTDERSMKLVADAHEEDCHATCEELLELREQNLRRKTHKNRPRLFMARPLMFYENSRPHIADVITKKLRDYGWKVLPRASSSDVSPPDLLILKIKRT